MKALIEQCWADDAKLRPSFSQLTQRLKKKDANLKEARAPLGAVSALFVCALTRRLLGARASTRGRRELLRGGAARAATPRKGARGPRGLPPPHSGTVAAASAVLLALTGVLGGEEDDHGGVYVTSAKGEHGHALLCQSHTFTQLFFRYSTTCFNLPSPFRLLSPL